MKNHLPITPVILFLIISLFLPICSTAQYNWDKYEENPVITLVPWGETAGNPVVIFEDQVLKMWMTSWDDQVAYAESTDGIDWTFTTDTVFPQGTSSDWDYAKLPGSVLRINDTLKMWYAGTNDPTYQVWAIGYAWSVDNIEWNTLQEPVLEKGAPGTWDEKSVLHPKVYFDGQTYHMWYSGKMGNLYDPMSIGYAFSSDGILWEKDTLNNPVMSPGSYSSFYDTYVSASSILFLQDTLYLYFTGWDGDNTSPFSFRIGCATSIDGIEWTVQNNELPVLDISEPPAWDDGWIRYCSVIIHEGRYKMWYDGTSGTPANRNIGYALGDSLPDVRISENNKLISNDPMVFPNPTDGILNLRFWISGSQNVIVRLFDDNGREVRNVLDKKMPEGEYVIPVDLSDMAKGIYYAVLVTDQVTSTKKIIRY